MQIEVSRSALIRKVIFRLLLACALCVFLFAFLFPVFAFRLMGRRWAYQATLAEHSQQFLVSHQLNHLSHNVNERPVYDRQHCLLFLSWFPDGDTYFSRSAAVGTRGALRFGMHIYNSRSGNGEGEPIEDKEELKTLERLAELPPGLASPNDVSPGSLLIVSSGLRGRWITRYYDRAHLPAPIDKIVQLLNLDLNTRYQSF